MDNSDKLSQMGFHDVRYQLSVTESLNVSGFFTYLNADGQASPRGTANLNENHRKLFVSQFNVLFCDKKKKKNTTTWLYPSDLTTPISLQSDHSHRYKQAQWMIYNYSLAQVWLPSQVARPKTTRMMS